MANILSKRFEELAEQLKTVEATKRREQMPYDDRPVERVDAELLLNWVVKAKNLLSHACGLESQHFVHFVDAEHGGMYCTNADNLQRMKAVFLAAQEDFDGGYVSTVRSMVQAEVFDSELDQASELLKSGYKISSAVIAGTVLETALRELCTKHKIPHGKLERMNADLAKEGVYSVLVQKQVTSLAHVRNSAAHGKADDFGEADVRAMIGDVQRFLTHQLG